MVIVILELENLTELLYATELKSQLYCQHNPQNNKLILNQTQKWGREKRIKI